MTVHFSLCTLCCMRSVFYRLVLSCCLSLAPGISCASVAEADGLRTPQLQSLLESEFAFQSGQFVRALAYYKDRQVESLSLAELERSSQIAIAAGDADWLRRMLVSPAVSGQQELLRMRLSQSLQAGEEQAALSAWRALMALPDQRGVEIARQVIDVQSAQHQAVLDRVLARYAQSPGLSDEERYELFLYAIQWRQDELADALLKAIGTANGHARMAEVMNACLRGKQAPCLARIEALDPRDFDEIQRRSILALTRQFGLERQTYRWLMALPQNGGSYYQRIVLLGRQFDEAKAVSLAAEIDQDAELSGFQRAALQGSIAELRKDWSAAEAQYRDALAHNAPTTASIRLAVVLFRQNRKNEALELLTAIQANAALSDEIRRDAFVTEIQFLQMSGQNPESVSAGMDDIYRRALRTWPQAHRLRYQFAMRLFSQGQVQQALDELQTVLQSTPADVDALNAYGYTLAKEMDRPRSAFKAIEQAFLIAPNRAEVLDSYGYVLHRLGRNSQALPPLQKAWDTTPSAVTAGHLGQVFWQLGDLSQAQNYLDKGLELDADEAELIKLRELLL
jgi:tetratricopeptide (TPR) repeat protein